jgi:copper chaperone CopZ
MEPIEGVSKTMINVPLKQVTVDHDPSVITGKDIENVLNKNRFGATLKRDGGGRAAGGSDGRSQFHVQKICCASEIPAINSILNPIHGVSKVSINVTTKMVRTGCYNS